MGNRLLICGLFFGTVQALSAETNGPADALRPENRSELAVLSERLAALERQAAAQASVQEARIARLERQVREYQLIHAPLSVPVVRQWHPLPPSRAWFQVATRFLPDGEFAWKPPERTPNVVPKPHRSRAGINSFYEWGHGNDPMLDDARGRFLVDFWIAPPWPKGNPLEGGHLLGVDLEALRVDQSAVADELDRLLLPEERLLRYSVPVPGR